jgi:hypothetical protein
MALLTGRDRGYKAAEREFYNDGKWSLEKMVKTAESSCDFDDFDRGVLDFWEKVKNKRVLRIYCQLDGWEFKSQIVNQQISNFGLSKLIRQFQETNKKLGAPLWGWHIEY